MIIRIAITITIIHHPSKYDSMRSLELMIHNLIRFGTFFAQCAKWDAHVGNSLSQLDDPLPCLDPPATGLQSGPRTDGSW